MSIGSISTVQSPNVLKARLKAETYAEMRTNLTDGKYSAGDFVVLNDANLHGIFKAIARTTQTDDGGCIITDGGSLYLLRLFTGAQNVRWYGAVGDGVTNDTSALQACIDSTLAKEKECPEGNYLYSGLTIDVEGVKLVGEGNIVESSGTNISRLTMDNTAADAVQFNADHTGIEGIEIYGNGNNNHGLNLSGGAGYRSRVTLSDVIVKGFTKADKAGINLNKTVLTGLHNVSVENCYDGLLVEVSTTTTITGKSSFRESTRDNIRYSSSSGFNMFGGVVEGAGGNGASIANNASICRGVEFFGTWFEGNTDYAIRSGIAGEVKGLAVMGCPITGSNGGNIGLYLDDNTRGAYICSNDIEEFDNAAGNDDGIYIGSSALDVTLVGNRYQNNTTNVTDNSNKAVRINDGTATGTILIGDGTLNPGNGNTGDGVQLAASGRLQASYDGDHVFNRNGSDGDIVSLHKNGSGVNSIQAVSGVSSWKNPHAQKAYTVASLPSASTYQGCIVMVTDEAGGYTAAFSDGSNWRRMQDRAVVS